MGYRRHSGQAFLALVFMIGAIVAIVGILIAFFANSFVDTGYGLSASANAEAIANSGAQDAMLQLDRNISFATSSYQVVVGSSTATVSVTQSPPYVTIVSSATVSNHKRKVQVVLYGNASTSQLNVVSWQDVQ